MAIVTGDRYMDSLVKFVEKEAGPLIEGALVLKLNPVGLHYVHSRLEALQELEGLLAGAPVDYLRAYVSDLGDHRALEQLRRILRLLPSLKVVSVLPPSARDPTPLPLLPFVRLRVLELRGCDLSTSAAKGLLELRHTLEKIICHDSTDALRHVFASRIAEIKDSPHWNRLTFISCACNGLVIMDESLQLLPAVETLDLSRNKFAKIDNLRKCTKLKHLDLGFNHLRTTASFSEASCQIVKLVLRNNALTTLRGIENLKSLEGLDLSYNVISKFSELEIIVGLPALRNLWLEGNPLCCARWYRAHVFSFFTYPHKVKLDEKGMSTKEFWKKQIIVAGRQKRPASFGFYSPALYDAEEEGSMNRKRKKLSRLALIEGEQSSLVCSDQESVSCDTESNKGENVVSDNEAEIADLMSKVELMKKEHSVLWLREFKEWMVQDSENLLDRSRYDGSRLNSVKEYFLRTDARGRDLVKSSNYVLDDVQALGDKNGANILETKNSFANVLVGLQAPLLMGEASSKFMLGDAAGKPSCVMDSMVLDQEQLKSDRLQGVDCIPTGVKNSRSVVLPGHTMDANVCTSFAAIDDILESHISSGCSGSPPHYQKDILHRRQNLVEEILQLSADSFSLASSESCTSESEEDHCEFEPSTSENVFNSCVGGHFNGSLSEGNHMDQRNEVLDQKEIGEYILISHAGQSPLNLKSIKPDDRLQQTGKWWLKRRFVSPSEDTNLVSEAETSDFRSNISYLRLNEDGQRKWFFNGSVFPALTGNKPTLRDTIMASTSDCMSRILFGANQLSAGIDEFICSYFNTNLGDSRVQEVCRQYMLSKCVLETDSECKEREVAVILSSEQKLYVLLIDLMLDGPETAPRLIGCHKLEEVQDVLVGLGLHVVRVCFQGDVTYLFITRKIEKCKQLLCALKDYASSDKFILRSLEQVQVNLLEKHICGGLQVSIFQYSLVLFWRKNSEEELWLSRSLFLIRGHVLVCIEDYMQFGSLFRDTSPTPYFLLDSCCSIADVSELVIETGDSWCVTLALEFSCSELCCKMSTDKPKDITRRLAKRKATPATWKLRWLSEESLFNFVALLKASHAETAMSPLAVRHVQ